MSILLIYVLSTWGAYLKVKYDHSPKGLGVGQKREGVEMVLIFVPVLNTLYTLTYITFIARDLVEGENRGNK